MYSHDLYLKNKESYLRRSRERRLKHPEEVKEGQRKYYLKNREKFLKKSKEYRLNNLEKTRIYQKEYKIKNKEAINKISRERDKIRRKTDIQYRISQALRVRLRLALKGKKKDKRITDLLGCSILFLKDYLQSKFKDGMSWENHGEWHIDHIIPISSFDLTKESELKLACNYRNLQPLWAKENIEKGCKLSPFGRMELEQKLISFN